MLDYETKGYSQYGAWMGRNRREEYSVPRDTTAKLHLRRVRLDSGGYDRGGAYWGHGEPLWCVWGDSGEDTLTTYLRAADRGAAKAHFPNAKFWR